MYLDGLQSGCHDGGVAKLAAVLQVLAGLQLGPGGKSSEVCWRIREITEQ